MRTYRVHYKRTTSIELYIDVEASDAAAALHKANIATSESDDPLTEIPDSYNYDIYPTGEIEEK